MGDEQGVNRHIRREGAHVRAGTQLREAGAEGGEARGDPLEVRTGAGDGLPAGTQVPANAGFEAGAQPAPSGPTRACGHGVELDTALWRSGHAGRVTRAAPPATPRTLRPHGHVPHG
jgi:hypothetical protein